MTKGILIDAPKLRGVEWLEPGDVRRDFSLFADFPLSNPLIRPPPISHVDADLTFEAFEEAGNPVSTLHAREVAGSIPAAREVELLLELVETFVEVADRSPQLGQRVDDRF
jgi:hypothetical protein